MRKPMDGGVFRFRLAAAATRCSAIIACTPASTGLPPPASPIFASGNGTVTEAG